MPAMASATVARQLLDRTHVRDTALVVAISAIVAATGAFAAGQLLPVVEYWSMDLPGGIGWPGWTPFFGPTWLTAWIAGGLFGCLTALVLSGRAQRRWLRFVAGAYGAWCAAVIAALIWLRPDATLSATGAVVELDDRAPVHLCAFGAGLVAALYVALRRRVPAPTSRALTVPLTVAACLAIGVPTLVETVAEYRPQELRSFRLELVAAYPLREVAEGEMPAVVIDRNGSPGEVIESDGHRFNIHRSDRLIITSDQVERVRWIDSDDAPTISIRLDRDTAAALGHRSNRRISQYDALFLDGHLVGVPIYNDLVTRLWYASPDRDAQRAFYQALTGAPR